MEQSEGVVEMSLRRLGSRRPTISVVGYEAVGGFLYRMGGSSRRPRRSGDGHRVRKGRHLHRHGWDLRRRSLRGVGCDGYRGMPDVMVFTKVLSAPRGKGYRPTRGSTTRLPRVPPAMAAASGGTPAARAACRAVTYRPPSSKRGVEFRKCAGPCGAEAPTGARSPGRGRRA